MDWDFFNQNLSMPLNYKKGFSEHCFLETFVVVVAVFSMYKKNLLKSQQECIDMNWTIPAYFAVYLEISRHLSGFF